MLNDSSSWGGLVRLLGIVYPMPMGANCQVSPDDGDWIPTGRARGTL